MFNIVRTFFLFLFVTVTSRVTTVGAPAMPVHPLSCYTKVVTGAYYTYFIIYKSTDLGWGVGGGQCRIFCNRYVYLIRVYNLIYVTIMYSVEFPFLTARFGLLARHRQPPLFRYFGIFTFGLN